MTATPLSQFVRVIDGVPRFMSHDAHAPFGRASLHFEHHRALEPLQARMRQVKRDRDARHAVGCKPFVREPEMRLECGQAPFVQFALQLRDPIREHALLDRHAELAHLQIEELFIRPVGPLIGWQHSVRRHLNSL